MVWQPNDVLTAHAGYSRYFTPPPLDQVSDGADRRRLRHDRRARSHAERSGAGRARRTISTSASTLKPLAGLTLGVDAYYKIATNLLDEGQFGAPIILTSFNYANGHRQGRRAHGELRQRPVVGLFGNIAWSAGARAPTSTPRSSTSRAAELAYIANN